MADAKGKIDLLSLFGVKPSEVAAARSAPAAAGRPPVSDSVLTAVTSPVTAAAPEHATDVDLWGQRRGRELLSGEYAELLKPLDLGKGDATREAAAADLFASAYEPDPTLNPSCIDPMRHEFLSRMYESDEFHALRASTQLDDSLSEIAAANFAQRFAELRATRETPKERKPGQTDEDAALDREIEAMEAAGKAVEDAKAEVDLALDAAAACGIGGDGAKAGITIPPKAIGALYKRVANDFKLRRICELAGRFRHLAQGKQRNKLGHGYDDMVGVEPGGDVGRLVGSELAALCVPELETEVAIRLVENRALCREHKGVEPVGKGPIVVTVDESGSMSGEKIATAKALALAMAWIARAQRRWCCLVGFSGSTQGTFCVLPPGRWDENALCDWLTHFYSGGTDLDIPIEVLPKKWPALVESGLKRGKTDILMITDAIVRLPDALEKSFNDFKAAEQVKLTAIVVQSKPGDLTRIADEVYQVDKIGVTEEAVATAVSV